MPDLNVWLALSWAHHIHSHAAWAWFSRQKNNRLVFCRLTQIGLLRLLVTSSVMGKDVLTISEAWKVYDRWLEDPSIDLRQEAHDIDQAFREATRPLSRQSSPKALGDCYLLAASQVIDATLVTFDHGLESACRKARHPVLLLAPGE